MNKLEFDNRQIFLKTTTIWELLFISGVKEVREQASMQKRGEFEQVNKPMTIEECFKYNNKKKNTSGKTNILKKKQKFHT